MDFWCRFGLKEKEWARGSLLLGARPAFVCALMLSFRETKAKKHQDRLLAFTLLNRDRLRLVFAPTAVETIMDQLDNPLAVKDTIIQVVSANDLGEALFDDFGAEVAQPAGQRSHRERGEEARRCQHDSPAVRPEVS